MGEIIHVPDDGSGGRSHGSIQWHAEPGTSIRGGELIAEIEFGSVTKTITASERGILYETFVANGQDVVPGGPIGVIVESPDEFLGLPWGVASEVEASGPVDGDERNSIERNTA